MKVDLNEPLFWELIEQANTSDSWQTYDVDEHTDKVTALLSELESGDMISFEAMLRKKLDELDKVDIGELGIILGNSFEEKDGIYDFNGYVSTDGFIYFRCWLILKGKEFFYDILKDINVFVSGKYCFDIGDTWGEGLLYVANQAYDVKTGQEDSYFVTDAVEELYPEIIDYDSFESEGWVRPPYIGTELQVHYPKLVAEIGELRNEEK